MENNSGKVVKFMKKLITAVSLLVLISCLTLVLVGCGAEDENVTTTTPTTTMDTSRDAMEEGMVTDTSEKGDNGIIGDIVTDASEIASDVVTDISDDISENK